MSVASWRGSRAHHGASLLRGETGEGAGVAMIAIAGGGQTRGSAGPTLFADPWRLR